jgi:hypothetical protein
VHTNGGLLNATQQSHLYHSIDFKISQPQTRYRSSSAVYGASPYYMPEHSQIYPQQTAVVINTESIPRPLVSLSTYMYPVQQQSHYPTGYLVQPMAPYGFSLTTTSNHFNVIYPQQQPLLVPPGPLPFRKDYYSMFNPHACFASPQFYEATQYSSMIGTSQVPTVLHSVQQYYHASAPHQYARHNNQSMHTEAFIQHRRDKFCNRRSQGNGDILLRQHVPQVGHQLHRSQNLVYKNQRSPSQQERSQPTTSIEVPSLAQQQLQENNQASTLQEEATSLTNTDDVVCNKKLGEN